MSTPLVTIRCLVYNHEPYLRQCLDGFVMQKTNFPFEAIVHDDASTDRSAEIIREYAEKYPDIIKPIFEKENQYSKHDGTIGKIMREHTKGKYVAMCEGDDYWIDPLKLQKQVDLMENNPLCGMCYAQVKSYYQKKSTFGEVRGENCESFEKLLTINTIPSLTCLIDNKLLQKYVEDVNPSAKQWKMGDYPMWLWFAHESTIAFIPEVVGVYRILEKSACHSFSTINKVQFIISTYEIRSFFAEKFASPQLPQILDKIFWWNYILSILKKDKENANTLALKLQGSIHMTLLQKIVLYLGRINLLFASLLIKYYLKRR